MSQSEINALLVRHAKAGRRVARLKGGDPFVFGRGGEEAAALRAAGAPYEVIPGVTSAVAAPAYAGIPVTHRDYAASFAVVTGCRSREQGADCQDWAALARMDTLVILMGMRNLAQIAERLTASGRPSTTPAAVIQWGTTPRQKAILGTLADIAELARELGPPATIVIGEVAALAGCPQTIEAAPIFAQIHSSLSGVASETASAGHTGAMYKA